MPGIIPSSYTAVGIDFVSLGFYISIVMPLAYSIYSENNGPNVVSCGNMVIGSDINDAENL